MRAGFTLIELLLVSAVGVFVVALTIPVGVGFFQSQRFDETANEILSSLRRTGASAIAQKNDRPHGVKFLPDAYVIFEGTSYAARVVLEDEVIPLPSGFAIAGTNEIVFGKLTGTSSYSGAIQITSGARTRSILINAEGIIQNGS